VSKQQQGSNIDRHRHLTSPAGARRSQGTKLWTLSMEIVGDQTAGKSDISGIASETLPKGNPNAAKSPEPIL
jgi:hypothetical protein